MRIVKPCTTPEHESTISAGFSTNKKIFVFYLSLNYTAMHWKRPTRKLHFHVCLSTSVSSVNLLLLFWIFSRFNSSIKSCFLFWGWEKRSKDLFPYLFRLPSSFLLPVLCFGYLLFLFGKKMNIFWLLIYTHSSGHGRWRKFFLLSPFLKSLCILDKRSTCE